jgi:intracellular multiplication protein IcmJ
MKELLPLTLGCRKQTFDMSVQHKPVMAGALRHAVLHEDGNQCRFCGFVSPKWMEIFHVDGDHKNNARENLVTACPLCHQCDHLDVAGLHKGGKIIWLPELDQGSLNLLCIAIFIAVFRDRDFAQSAREMYEMLSDVRGRAVEDYYGRGSANPLAWASQLEHLDDEDYEVRNERLEGLRLLPAAGRFVRPIRYWATEAFPSKYPEFWERLFEQASPLLEESRAPETSDVA